MSRLIFIAGGTCGSRASIESDRPALTTSFGIIRDTDGIVIDQGLGVQYIARRFLEDGNIKRIFILQTHLHDDHVNGIAFNSLLFQKKIPVAGIWAPVCEGASIDTVWQHRFAPHNWPVRPEMFGVEVPLHPFGLDLSDAGFLPLGITGMRLNHPGGSVAYRIPHERGDIVIATDHEPNDETDTTYAAFVSGTRLLVADMQYRDEEYNGETGINGGTKMSRQGWGHATPNLLAKALAGCQPLPKEIWITHHDPDRSDADFDSFIDESHAHFQKLGMNVSGFALEDEAYEL